MSHLVDGGRARCVEKRRLQKAAAFINSLLGDREELSRSFCNGVFVSFIWIDKNYFWSKFPCIHVDMPSWGSSPVREDKTRRRTDVSKKRHTFFDQKDAYGPDLSYGRGFESRCSLAGCRIAVFVRIWPKCRFFTSKSRKKQTIESYVVLFLSKNNYQKILSEIRKANFLLDKLIHLWTKNENWL